MPTDEEAFCKDILLEKWNESNTPLPSIYFDDSYKSADAKHGIVKIYYRWSPPIRPRGIGFPCKDVEFNIMFDVRGASRDQVLKMRDELIRIFDSVRVSPKLSTQTSSNYHFLVYSEGEKVNSYAGFYQWYFLLTLKQLCRDVGGI